MDWLPFAQNVGSANLSHPSSICLFVYSSILDTVEPRVPVLGARAT